MTRCLVAGLLAALLLPRTADAFQHEHHGQPTPKPAQHDHSKPGEYDHAKPIEAVPPLPPHVQPITDADRKAAFPDVEGHTVHDEAVHYFVLLDQLEWQFADGGGGLNLDSRGWVGRDVDRLWFRAEGDADDGEVTAAEAQLLYGRRFSNRAPCGRGQRWACRGLRRTGSKWKQPSL